METNVLYCNDNLERLAAMPDESVNLVYLDPPFFSNRVYEVIWGDEAEVRSFEDRWEGGIRHYSDWMRERLEELHRVLSPTGSVYLHCDPHASHYLKVMMDEIFGYTNFRSELIWKRTGSHNSARRWGPVHDTILFYTKSSSFTWNPVHQPYSSEYEARFKRKDERGRFTDVSLTGPGVRQSDSGLPWGGHDPTAAGRHWQPPSTAYDVYEQLTGETLDNEPMHVRLDRLDDAGLIFWPAKKTGVPRFKQYLHAMKGVPAQDVITDLPPINSQSAERLGYPTQKPEALLERIVTASSNPGDVVLDPFCGCGTTIAVAHRTGRDYVGIDISPTAMEIMRRRMWNQSRHTPQIVDTPETEEALKLLQPFEFQNWIINAMNGSHSPRQVHDMGIDGYSFFTKDPIQVKQSEKVGRNVIDNFETAVRRAGGDTGYVIAFSFTKGAVEEAARAKSDGLLIKLVRVKEVLMLTRRTGRTSNKLGPQPEGDLMILPETRQKKDLPTVADLVASNRDRIA